MNFAIYNSQLGKIRIEHKNNIVTFLKKVEDDNFNEVQKTDFTDDVFKQVLEYFDGKRKVFDFKYEMQGTDFQKKVWSALLEIPYGETRTYKDIAKAIGNEKASRAVGNANNKNPVTIVVPCHRVIGTSGKLVGYAGGLKMKEYLLEMELENK